MKVFFSARAIHNMAGGVERMITTIMNAMVQQGYEIELITWDQKGARSFYPMSANILWHKLDIGNPLRRAKSTELIKRAIKVRQLVKSRKPDVMVAFQDGPFLALKAFTLGMNIPIIAAERNSPTRFEHTNMGLRKKQITTNAFRLAKQVVVQCESYRNLYPDYLRHLIVTIPNPVSSSEVRAMPDLPNVRGRYQLLSVARLSYQKNHTSLIEAFGHLAPNFPDWDLVIVGEGEERYRLENIINDRGLSDRIRLPGSSREVMKHYTSSHLFCLPSRWEGFPNALAEALSHGLPAVGYADCAGVNELIRDGVNGYLARGNGGPDDLVEPLSLLMSSPEIRQEYGTRGPVMMEEYSPNTIIQKWQRVIETAAA